jgi:hypothetical protein
MGDDSTLAVSVGWKTLTVAAKRALTRWVVHIHVTGPHLAALAVCCTPSLLPPPPPSPIAFTTPTTSPPPISNTGELTLAAVRTHVQVSTYTIRYNQL